MNKKKIIIWSILVITFGLSLYFFYPDEKLPNNAIADKIVVLKSKRQLVLYYKDVVLKTYKISLGGNPTGHKQYEGDNKTPEGIYSISSHGQHNMYHKYLYVSYPNKNDKYNAAKLGKSAGGQILIHGLNKKYAFIKKIHRWYDWTKGCIAVTNDEVDEIYNAVKVGTRIDIRP